VVEIVQSNPIPSRDLVIGHVPAFDLRTLDPHWDGPSTAQWGEFWSFALTFNGYRNTGLSNELWVLANEVRERYANDGEPFTLGLFWRRASKDAYTVRCSPDKAAYLQALLDAIRAEVRRQQVRLIQTKDLRDPDVPRIDPELRESPGGLTFGYEPHPVFHEVWEFARTFDAYRYFAVDDIHGRLGEFATSVKQEFRVTGEVPGLGDIGMLRACLAYEEHRWCAWGDDDSVVTSDDVRYLAALLEAIRSRLH